MKTLRLIQVGDVHYPDRRDERLGDIKDDGFPVRVADAMQLTPIQCVVRAITAEMDLGPKALLFCGDITSRGNVKGYQDCLEYLAPALRLNKWHPNHVHAVPGNHDVDRTAIDPNGVDLYTKFDRFRKAWEDIGLPILTVDTHRDTTVKLGNTQSARIFSLNSSLGCGEKRFLPTSIKNELSTLLTAYVASVGADKAFETIGETLDTPGFSVDHIDTICAAIRQSKESVMPIVLSHHNILPQALLRVDVYTEAINAGLVRSRLAQVRRPVIYCHGHIHENPVEIVHQVPITPYSALICISAPELSRGFNVLQIEYGSRGMPLGCRLSQKKLRLTDGEMESSERLIPFYKPDQLNLRRLGHSLLPRILANLPDTDIRFPDLSANLSGQDQKITSSPLSKALQEGEWLGFISLDNREYAPEYWTVKKVVRH